MDKVKSIELNFFYFLNVRDYDYVVYIFYSWWLLLYIFPSYIFALDCDISFIITVLLFWLYVTYLGGITRYTQHCRKSAVSIHLWPVIRSSAMMRWTNSLFVSWRMQAIIFVFCCIIFVFISWRNNSACVCTILVTSELSVGLENIVIAMATIAVKLRNCENWPQQGHFVVVVVVRWCCALQPSLFNHFLRTECVWYGQAIQHRQCESEVWFN